MTDVHQNVVFEMGKKNRGRARLTGNRCNTQTVNQFLYNTSSVSTDNRTPNSCNLEVGNGNEYPEQHYKPDTEPTRESIEMF